MCVLDVCNVISIVSAFSETAFRHLGVHCSVSVLNIISGTECRSGAGVYTDLVHIIDMGQGMGCHVSV